MQITSDTQFVFVAVSKSGLLYTLSTEDSVGAVRHSILTARGTDFYFLEIVDGKPVLADTPVVLDDLVPGR